MLLADVNPIFADPGNHGTPDVLVSDLSVLLRIGLLLQISLDPALLCLASIVLSLTSLFRLLVRSSFGLFQYHSPPVLHGFR